MARCPAGHESQASDYCDTCGLVIGGEASSGAAAPLAAAIAAPPPSLASSSGGSAAVAAGGAGCPVCQAERNGRFCEECGYDFDLAEAMPQVAMTPGVMPTEPANAQAANGHGAGAGAGGHGVGEQSAGGQGVGGQGVGGQGVGGHGVGGQGLGGHGVGGQGVGGQGVGGQGTQPESAAAGTPAEQGLDLDAELARAEAEVAGAGAGSGVGSGASPIAGNEPGAGSGASSPFVGNEPAAAESEAAEPALPVAESSSTPAVAPDAAEPESAATGIGALSALSGAGATGAEELELLVNADSDYYAAQVERGDIIESEFPFPKYPLERRFTFSDGPVRIGRASASRGLSPEIDLTGPPLDPAVSHLHAQLLRHVEGWVVVDLGSANGTRLNDADEPLEAETEIPVKQGDRIHLGVWTTITVQ